MFVALDRLTKARVTSLSPEWVGRTEQLRELARGDGLICPGCEQSLIFKAGEVLRPHFAHRSSSECPLDRQSAEVLETKAKLYQWLVSKFPGSVELDVDVGYAARLADLTVSPKPGRRFVYWVFDRRVAQRDAFFGFTNQSADHHQFIHTQSTLVRSKSGGIALAAWQRELLQTSDFDKWCWPSDGHIHFVDGNLGLVRIYRGLHCVHRPNVFRWEALQERKFSMCLISPSTGEMVVQADVEKRAEWREHAQQRARAEQKRKVASRNVEKPKPVGELPPDEVTEASKVADARHEETPTEAEPEQPPAMNLTGPFRCEDCGVVTKDFSSFAPALGTCVCRECTHKRHLEAIRRSGSN